MGMERFKAYLAKFDLLGLLRLILLGWQVLFSEIQWAITQSLRQREVQQLHKRLKKEQQHLGKLMAKQGDQPAESNEEIDLCRRQISFFEQEIEFLEQEIAQTRTAQIEQRKQQWGLID